MMKSAVNVPSSIDTSANFMLYDKFEVGGSYRINDSFGAMVIFVKSHTDSKGSAPYNLKLSEQRAQSTVQYIISKGIESERISGKGFGNTEPKIACGADCTEEQNSQNRRSEFTIVKK